MSELIPKDKGEPLPGQKDITRRDFLGLVLRCGFFITLAGMVIPALSYLAPVTRRGPAGGLTDVGSVDDIPLWGGKKVSVAGSAVILIHAPDGFKAYSAVCPHLGCLVGWEDARRVIVCPCHAGIFDMDGRVVSGPPPRGLTPREVSVVGGRLMVKAA